MKTLILTIFVSLLNLAQANAASSPTCIQEKHIINNSTPAKENDKVQLMSLLSSKFSLSDDAKFELITMTDSCHASTLTNQDDLQKLVQLRASESQCKDVGCTLQLLTTAQDITFTYCQNNITYGYQLTQMKTNKHAIIKRFQESTEKCPTSFDSKW